MAKKLASRACTQPLKPKSLFWSRAFVIQLFPARHSRALQWECGKELCQQHGWSCVRGEPVPRQGVPHLAWRPAFCGRASSQGLCGFREVPVAGAGCGCTVPQARDRIRQLQKCCPSLPSLWWPCPRLWGSKPAAVLLARPCCLVASSLLAPRAAAAPGLTLCPARGRLCSRGSIANSL